MKKSLLSIAALLLYLSASAQGYFDNTELNIINNPPKDNILYVLQTTVYEDSLKLRRIAAPVNIADPLLPKCISLLYKTVNDPENEGVGIAAPQVGINKRLFMLQRFDKPDEPFEAIINPHILWRSNLMQTGREGCLSIPDTMGMVDRHYAILVQYQKTDGTVITEALEGFTAIIFQHEYDHINGVLFIDRLTEQHSKEYTAPNNNLKYLSEKNTR